MTILRDLHARHYAIFRTAGKYSTITACGLNNADANLYELTMVRDRVTCRSCLTKLNEQSKREHEAKVRAGLATTTPDEDEARARAESDRKWRETPDDFVHYRPDGRRLDPAAVCGKYALAMTDDLSRVTCRACVGLAIAELTQRRVRESSTLDPRVHYARFGEDSKARPACNLEYRGAFFSTADECEVTCLLCRRAIDPLATVAYKSSMTIAPTPTITPTTITPVTLPDGARVRILPFAEIPLGGVFEVAFDQAMDGSLPNFYFDLEQRARKHAPRRFHVEYRDPTAPPDTPLPQSLRVWRIE